MLLCLQLCGALQVMNGMNDWTVDDELVCFDLVAFQHSSAVMPTLSGGM